MAITGTHRTRNAVLALVLACCLAVGSSGIADAVTVGVRGIFNGTSFVWSPKTRSIARGTIVRWRAVDGNHTVQSRGSNWSFFRNLPQGTYVARRFRRVGTFRYYCTIHGRVVNGVCTGMCGKIVVS